MLHEYTSTWFPQALPVDADKLGEADRVFVVARWPQSLTVWLPGSPR